MSEDRPSDELTRDDLTRASDAERDAVVGLLIDAMVSGRITEAELAERTKAALSARTRAALAVLVADLPSPRDRIEPLIDELLREAELRRISRGELALHLLSRS
jgi:hypothetical protein